MKELLKISFNEETGMYEINIPQGSSIPETAFGVSAMIKTFVREKIIKDPVEFLSLVAKYLDDPQYDEVQ